MSVISFLGEKGKTEVVGFTRVAGTPYHFKLFICCSSSIVFVCLSLTLLPKGSQGVPSFFLKLSFPVTLRTLRRVEWFQSHSSLCFSIIQSPSWLSQICRVASGANSVYRQMTGRRHSHCSDTTCSKEIFFLSSRRICWVSSNFRVMNSHSGLGNKCNLTYKKEIKGVCKELWKPYYSWDFIKTFVFLWSFDREISIWNYWESLMRAG